jgi:hypothetical protein
MDAPIRLEFLDETGKISNYYSDEQTATYDYELFIEGSLHVADILRAM